MLRLYLDVHVKAAITAGLRRRGIDVVTAQDDGATRLEDVPLLDRAIAPGRVLFSQDDDLLAIARVRQTQGGGLCRAHLWASTRSDYWKVCVGSRSSLHSAGPRGYGESDRISPLGLESLFLCTIAETSLRWPQASPWVTHRAAPGSIFPAPDAKRPCPLSSIVRARASHTKALHNKSNPIVGDLDGYQLKPDAIFPRPFHWCVGLDFLPAADTAKAARTANDLARETQRRANDIMAKSDRPWVGLQYIALVDYAVGEKPSAKLPIITSGQTPVSKRSIRKLLIHPLYQFRIGYISSFCKSVHPIWMWYL